MKFQILLLVVILIFVNCQKEYDNLLSIHPSEKEMVYFNSFEATRDTTNHIERGNDDVLSPGDGGAPSCGDQALYVLGGCIQPAAQFRLIAPKAGQYQMGVWARLTDLEQPGQIVFCQSDQSEQSICSVVDTNWTYYLSEKLESVEQGDTLLVEIVIGGFIAAEMWVDCLTIEVYPD